MPQIPCFAPIIFVLSMIIKQYYLFDLIVNINSNNNIQNYSMSYGRHIQPQILSIEAIVQKSEFKSKILNNIPIDLKKLFIQQASKIHPKKVQPNRIPIICEGIYSQTLDPIQHESHYRTSKNKNVPQLKSSKSVRSKSLNSSKNNKNINDQHLNNVHAVQTTRTAAINSRQTKRARHLQRNSLEADDILMEQVQIKGENKQKQNCIASNNRQINANEQKQKANRLQNKNIIASKKFSQFQYQLMLPQRNSKNNGFKKVINNPQKGSITRDKKFQLPPKQPKQQKQSEQDENKVKAQTHLHCKSQSEQIVDQLAIQPHQQPQNQNIGTGFQAKHMSHGAIRQKFADHQNISCEYEDQGNFQHKLFNHPHGKKRVQTLQQPIPQFVIAALSEQTKKVSPVKNFNPYPPNYLQLNFQKTKASSKQKLTKQPACVVNMKKKITYNKIIRRSQQSVDQILEPKANFIKLYEKQRVACMLRKNSQIISRETKQKIQKSRSKQRDRVPSFSKTRGKKIVQEEVRGWDIQQAPQFYDQY